MYACEYGRQDVVKLLLDYSGSKNGYNLDFICIRSILSSSTTVEVFVV